MHNVTDPDNPHERPSTSVTLLSGAITVPIGATIPSGAFPFRDGDVYDWWRSEAPPVVVFPSRPQAGPLLSLNRIRDWLGDLFVLIPPIELRSYIQLATPGYGDPLIWTDQNGDPAVVLRTWRVLNTHSFSDVEPMECEGSDLIVRPDMVDLLMRLYGSVSLKELRVIWRRTISRDEGP